MRETRNPGAVVAAIADAKTRARRVTSAPYGEASGDSASHTVGSDTSPG